MNQPEGRVEMGELGSGVTGETLAGIAGIVLGVLGAVGVYPAVLLPVAAIVLWCRIDSRSRGQCADQ